MKTLIMFAIKSVSLSVMSKYVWNEYCCIFSFYLLDANKVILLKNATLFRLEQYLGKHR